MVQKEARNSLWHRQLRILSRWYSATHHAISSVQEYWLWVDLESCWFHVLGFHGDFVRLDQITDPA